MASTDPTAIPSQNSISSHPLTPSRASSACDPSSLPSPARRLPSPIISTSISCHRTTVPTPLLLRFLLQFSLPSFVVAWIWWHFLGCLAASCLNCEFYDRLEENYCEQVQFTYGGIFWDGSVTYGGYSEMLVTNKRYVVHIPDSLPMDSAAPLLCAGITVYSPMKQHGMLQPGKKLGVVGLGGLGHVAVKFGKAFGLHVTVISTSLSKKDDAIRHLGADNFLLSTDQKQMQAGSRSLDYVIDTVAAKHSLGPILDLLKVDGTLVLVGAPDLPVELPSFPLIFGRRKVAGSLIGGMKETQEMIDVCGKFNITCDIEVVMPENINDAIKRLEKNDVKYRFVIDIAKRSSL